MKRINWQLWGLFAVAVVLPSAIIGLSNYEIFPDVRLKMNLLLAMTVGAALIMASLADENAPSLRQMGIVLEVFLAFALYAGVVCHMGYARDLSASKQSRTELDALEEKQAARQKELSAAEVERLRALRSVLVQTPLSERGRLIPKTTPEKAATPNQTQTAAAILTPEKVREDWNPYLLYSLMIEAFLAIVAATAVFGMRYWDSNGNGVPEWIEQLPEQEVRRRFPEFAPILYPATSPNA